MNIEKVRIITLLNSIILLILIVFLFYPLLNKKEENKIVYIDNIKLFNDFNMTKDLNKINLVPISRQKKKMDSLYSLYQTFEEKEKNQEVKELEKKLRKEDQALKEMNAFYTKDLGNKVWSRLNDYIKKYGESNHYTIVIGTQGNGNVMYADSNIDITNDFITYSNNHYEGNLN